MSHARIISICQITIIAINYAHNGATLITKQGALKKKMRFFSASWSPNKWDSKYFESLFKQCLETV